MKKVVSMTMMSMMALLLVACGNADSTGGDDSQNSAQTEEASAETIDSSGNVLIAYFAVAENSNVDAVSSASVVTIDGEAKGLTRAVADWIQEETGGEEFSIQTDTEYVSDHDGLLDQAREEQDQQELPELITEIDNLDQYDTIFIGYPIWWYDLPQIMYSFFEEYDFAGKTIIPFATHNGSRFTGTIETIQELEPEATVIEDGLALRHSDVEGAKDDVDNWLNGLGY